MVGPGGTEFPESELWQWPPGPPEARALRAEGSFTWQRWEQRRAGFLGPVEGPRPGPAVGMWDRGRAAGEQLAEEQLGPAATASRTQDPGGRKG